MVAKAKRYTLVVNLHSRQAKKSVSELKKILKSKGVRISIIAVKDPKKLSAAFQESLDSKADVIVLGGGDGTLISGIEFLTLHGYTKPIGLLPLGTANYLVRNLDIPLDLEQSVDRLLAGKYRSIPVGVANDKFFALTFIVGITQKVANEVSDNLKQRVGQLAYLVELAKQTKNHKAFRYTIDSPSLRKSLKGKTHQLVVYNSDLNVQLKLVPDHEIAKDSLKVVISRSGQSMIKLYVGFLVHILSFGKLRPYMRVFEAKELTLKTEPILPADFDGEKAGQSPFDVHLHKQKIKIIC